MSDRAVPHAKAYPRLARVKDAMRFINAMARKGPRLFEATRSKEVARTYRIEEELVRRMKARKRTELSFSGEAK